MASLPTLAFPRKCDNCYCREFYRVSLKETEDANQEASSTDQRIITVCQKYLDSHKEDLNTESATKLSGQEKANLIKGCDNCSCEKVYRVTWRLAIPDERGTSSERVEYYCETLRGHFQGDDTATVSNIEEFSSVNAIIVRA